MAGPRVDRHSGRAGALPPRGHRRHYSYDDVLSGLLRCHCGRTMTPDHTKGRYYCGRSKIKPNHGPGSIAKAIIIPLVKDGMAHLDVPDAYTASETHEAERTALLERRRRLAILFADTLMDEETYRSELTGITRALDDLGTPHTSLTFQG